MSLKKTIDHNQGLVISMAIAAAIPLVFLGCHLTQAQKKDIIATAAITTEAVVEGAPLPWSQIGMAIGALFGSGTIIDNRRKDVLIRSLKKENATKNAIISSIVPANHRDPPGIRPQGNT